MRACVVLASLAPGCESEGQQPATGACQAAADATPELLANAQLDADLIARAAVVIGSCWPDDGVPRVAASLWSANIGSRRNYFLNVTQARCLADARCGCAAMEQCLGYTQQTGLAPDCQSRCDGEIFRGCGDDLGLREGDGISIDCAKVGLSCQLDGICVDDVGSSCDGSEAAECRDGARTLHCADSALREGPDCAALGLGCANGECQGTGAACANERSTSAELVTFEGISCQGALWRPAWQASARA